MFNKRHQEAHESFDKYLTDLRELVGRCHFGPMSEELLRDSIVCEVKNPSFRKQLLEKKGLTLHTYVDMCRANEVTAKQMKDMDTTEEVHTIASRRGNHQKPSGNISTDTPKKSNAKESDKKCSRCGRFHAKDRKKHCPTYGKTCGKCGKFNHYAHVCRSTDAKSKGKPKGKTTSKVQQIQVSSEEESDYEFLMTINVEQTNDDAVINRIER